MKPAVEIENAKFDYGTNPILKDVSFSVGEGDFFIIIGPNGSGKTTLMKLMAGVAELKKGSLRILDRPVQTYTRKALARTLALVPQTIPDEFPFRVSELVLMGRAPHQGVLGLESRRDMEIAARSMAFTGVDHLADRKLTQLSGGERQRVFIARAICQEPRIILLDEPTASLDLAHQVRVMDLMERLKEETHITVVMVSHDINLAAMYGDRLLLLKDGRLVSLGRPGEVLTYQSLENTYGCPLLVDQSPMGDFPRVTLAPGRCLNPRIKK